MTPALWGVVAPTTGHAPPGHAAATSAYNINTPDYPPPHPAEQYISRTPELSSQQSRLQPFPKPPSGFSNAREYFDPRSQSPSYPRPSEQHTPMRQHPVLVTAQKPHHSGSGNWFEDAKARTEDFRRNGPRAPTTWVLIEGGSVPQGAYNGGEPGGKPIFIRRAHCEVSPPA